MVGAAEGGRDTRRGEPRLLLRPRWLWHRGPDSDPGGFVDPGVGERFGSLSRPLEVDLALMRHSGALRSARDDIARIGDRYERGGDLPRGRAALGDLRRRGDPVVDLGLGLRRYQRGGGYALKYVALLSSRTNETNATKRKLLAADN